MESKWDNFPDLGEAFEAVKGVLFGPLDAGFLRHKFGEIVRERVEKRDLEMNPRGLFGLERDERELRERKDRYQHNLTLTALLAQDAAYRAAHQRAMDAIGDAGRAIGRAIERLQGTKDANRKAMEDYLLTTARLPDGRYVMVDEQGRYWDQNNDEVRAEEAAALVGEVKAHGPYKARSEFADEIDKGLAELGVMEAENGDRHAAATRDKDPATLEEQEEIADQAEKAEEQADELIERMEMMDRRADGVVNASIGTEAPVVVSAALPDLSL